MHLDTLTADDLAQLPVAGQQDAVAKVFRERSGKAVMHLERLVPVEIPIRTQDR
jgi:hypothetical protein